MRPHHFSRAPQHTPPKFQGPPQHLHTLLSILNELSLTLYKWIPGHMNDLRK